MENHAENRYLKLEELDIGLSQLRLQKPEQIKRMLGSIEHLGQLHPLIVRIIPKGYQIIDGFKRYYAAEQLGTKELLVKVLDITESAAKAMILNYNKDNNSLLDYEEAMIVYSLKRDHLLDQVQISKLLCCSRSWVCRRLSLIEKLDTSVQDEIKLGVLSNSHCRELVKLPRGNQKDMTKTIIGNNITSRESRFLIDKFLRANNKEEQNYILKHPLDVIEKLKTENEIYDCRLSKHANRLLKTIELLFLQQHLFIGQYNQVHNLNETEKSILKPKLNGLLKKSETIISLLTKKIKQ